ncbi:MULTISPECIES: hypothetical protein [unclassified Amycolatopsis]|uniref:hypothetical protein n=1 Tax=unclassified Amycolatopsis TaxID=2618356 RepID=UPI0021032927|nr:hypothetical protein [Amycolatopsis sp. DSM 110486]
MVTSEQEIARRIEETDSARSARRAEAANMIGELARRHSDLAGQLAELERELGATLTSAADVIDVAELAQITDIPAADLARWHGQAAKPVRGRKRKRTDPKTNGLPTAAQPPQLSSADPVAAGAEPS